MSNPWDVPPWPRRGDMDAERTYAGIGRVTSIWEMIEAELSSLYTFFIGRYDELDAIMEYGESAIFRARYANLRSAAEHYFIRNPNQGAEGELDRLSTMLFGYADRRNELAHGVVSRVDAISYFKNHLEQDALTHPNYMVIPSFHWRKKHNPSHGGPNYAYTSKEMLEISNDLFAIAIHTRFYITTLLPAELTAELQPMMA